MDEERLSELVRLAVREEIHRGFAEISAHLHNFFNGNRADISEKRRAAAHARWRKEKGQDVDAKDAVAYEHAEDAIAPVVRRKRSPSVIPEVPAEQVFICIPVIGGQEYPISKDLVAKLEGLYPAVDVHQTLREIAGWNMANPANRKTPGGMMSHITRWMQREQNRG